MYYSLVGTFALAYLVSPSVASRGSARGRTEESFGRFEVETTLGGVVVPGDLWVPIWVSCMDGRMEAVRGGDHIGRSRGSRRSLGTYMGFLHGRADGRAEVALSLAVVQKLYG